MCILVCHSSGLMRLTPSFYNIKNLSIVVSILFPLASHQISHWVASGTIDCLIKPCHFETKQFNQQKCKSPVNGFIGKLTPYKQATPCWESFLSFSLSLLLFLTLSFHPIMLLHHIHYGAQWYIIISKCNTVKSSEILFQMISLLDFVDCCLRNHLQINEGKIRAGGGFPQVKTHPSKISEHPGNRH